MTESSGQHPTDGPQHRGRHRNQVGSDPVQSGSRSLSRTSSSNRGRTVTVLALVVAIAGGAGLLTWFLRAEPATSAASTVNAAATATADQGAPGQTTAAPTIADPTASAQTASVQTTSAQTTAGATTSSGTSTAATCGIPGGVLTIAASPDIAGVISTVTESESSSIAPGCTIIVTPTDPAAFIADSDRVATVWIPDSSMWIEQATAAGLTTSKQSPSVATSPVVLALPATVAVSATAGGTPSIATLLATRTTAAPIRVGLPDPAQSAASVGAILASRSAVSGTPDARAAMTWAVRSSPQGLPIHHDELLARLAKDANTAVPVSEQAVIAYNGAAGSPAAVAIYPAADGVSLDYPVVTLAADQQSTVAAANLVRLLVGGTGRAALLEAGFRAPDGSANPSITAARGVNPALTTTSPFPPTQAVDEAIQSVKITNEPSRMLAVIDISGSMQAQVQGADGATRIELAKQAAARGLGLYPADSDIGLWVFSTNLTMASDHLEVIPVSTLGSDGTGGSGAQRLSQALGDVQAIPDGGTGLYDTVLDAVRTMRESWDPTRVNTVLILTDGMNDDMNTIGLDGLLATLAAEQDPNRPVPVISIAFGPDSDAQALSQISKATGGATYESRDPRQIGEIFLDAVGQRLCRPSC